MSWVGRCAAGVVVVCVGAWGLRLALGAWVAGMVLGPMLWGAMVYALARIDRSIDRHLAHTTAAPPGRRAAPRQLDPARAGAVERMADAVLDWERTTGRTIGPSRRGRGAA